MTAQPQQPFLRGNFARVQLIIGTTGDDLAAGSGLPAGRGRSTSSRQVDPR